jgi:hypothetical protein
VCVAAFVADGHEFVAAGDAQFVAFDAGKRFEGRTSRLPVRTMAVCIDELSATVTDDAAPAPSTEEVVTVRSLAVTASPVGCAGVACG